MSFKVRTLEEDGWRSSAMLRLSRATRASFCPSERSSAMPEAWDKAGDPGTSKTGPSRGGGGFDDGPVGVSCFARGVTPEAEAVAPPLSAK